jgi:hypothetical protein
MTNLWGQRQNTPDVIGVLRVDQSWGSAQLSGACIVAGR